MKINNKDLCIVVSSISAVAAVAFIIDAIVQLDWWTHTFESRSMGVLTAVLIAIISIMAYLMSKLYAECDKCPRNASD